VGSSTVIVIPCYNEARRLNTEKFAAFSRAQRPQRLLFVDDGSTDETATVLQRLCEDDPQRFTFYHLLQNHGKAEAVRKGILRALEEQPTYIGYWDADLSTPLETIQVFCDLLDTHPQLEIVFGARVRLLGRTIERSPLRHYTGRAFATVASLTLGLDVYDTQCGAKLLRASPMIQALFQQPFITRWLLDIEILARLVHRVRRGSGLRPVEEVVYEFPLLEWRDVTGSKVRAHDFFTALFQLALIYWKYLR